MERVLSGRPEVTEPRIAMVMLETVITVPTEHLGWLLPALRRGGIEAQDTGQRTTTEEAMDALADVRVRVAP